MSDGNNLRFFHAFILLKTIKLSLFSQNLVFIIISLKSLCNSPKIIASIIWPGDKLFLFTVEAIIFFYIFLIKQFALSWIIIQNNLDFIKGKFGG